MAAETLARNVFLLEEAEALGAAFDQAQVPLVLLKGAAMLLRGMVPAGGRPMVDLDLLVRSADAGTAEELLLSLGYTREGETLDFARPAGPGRPWEVYVDLHTGLWHVEEDALWEETAPVQGSRGRLLTLTPEAMALHAMAHPLFSRGCLDARARGDLLAIAGRRDFSWDRFCSIVESSRLRPMAAAVLRELSRGGGVVPEEVLRRLSPAGMGKAASWVFRMGCSARPRPTLEYVLPLLARPVLLRRAFFPGRAELKSRYGDSSFRSLLRRQARLLLGCARKLRGVKG